ncbi:unnamed protein product, partial [Mesorhabditis spiculigera]
MGCDDIVGMLGKLLPYADPSTSAAWSPNPFGAIGTRPRTASDASDASIRSLKPTNNNSPFKHPSTPARPIVPHSSSIYTPPESPPNHNYFQPMNMQKVLNTPWPQQHQQQHQSVSPPSQMGYPNWPPFSTASPLNNSTPRATPPMMLTPQNIRNMHNYNNMQMAMQNAQPQQQQVQPAFNRQISEEDIEQQILGELSKMRTNVPTDYVCHRCNQKGHWIKFCPTKDPRMEKTPYQGDRPSTGFFACDDCGRKWKADARRNQSMTCRGCRKPVFPYKMMKKAD